MSVSIGKGAKVQMDNTSGTPVDLSSHLEDIKFPRDQESLESTVIGGSSRSKEFIPGLLSSKFTLVLHANSTTRTLINALYNQGYTGTTEYGPDGGDSGDVKYTAESFILKIDEDITPGGKKVLNVEVQGTGDVTTGTYA
jgi:hypothetical protein